MIVISSIKDVAKKAGVSVATVSRVINKTSSVSDETAHKVNKAIKSLNYSTNLLGRGLRCQQTKKVAVLLNTISNQFYSNVVRGIEDKAREHGYIVLICVTRDDPTVQDNYFQMIKQKLVDGAIFLSTSSQQTELSSQLENEFIVQACETRLTIDTPTVSIDNQLATFDAINYLIENGHNRIAFFGAGDIYQSSNQRLSGYKQALTQNNIPIDEGLILSEGFSYSAGERATATLLNNKNLPQAVFCCSDSCAMGTIKTLIKNNISVPQDISVMGFDNTHMAQAFIPSITTVKQPQYDMGYKSMELLLDAMNGKNTPQKNILLDYEIVQRESVLRRK